MLELRGSDHAASATTVPSTTSPSTCRPARDRLRRGNGAGKTTAMRIVFGVLAADAGRSAGAPRSPPASGAASATCPRSGVSTRSMRVHDQLVYFARLHGLDAGDAAARATDAARAAGLADRRGDKVETLSLGNQQRVQLAAALVHDPRADPRRALLGPRPPRRRRRGRRCCARRRGRRGRCCSRATSSTWSSASATSVAVHPSTDAWSPRRPTSCARAARALHPSGPGPRRRVRVRRRGRPAGPRP